MISNSDSDIITVGGNEEYRDQLAKVLYPNPYHKCKESGSAACTRSGTADSASLGSGNHFTSPCTSNVALIRRNKKYSGEKIDMYRVSG